MRTKRIQIVHSRETMSFGERIGLLSVKPQELIRPIQEHPRGAKDAPSVSAPPKPSSRFR
jgi:hypothetical protein